MSEYFEIAYAAASKKLCLFTGTGFSKALTEGKTPGWQELMENLCDDHVNNSGLKSALFPNKGGNPLRLEEATQIIGMNLEGQEKNLHETISEMVKSIPASGVIENIREFLSKKLPCCDNELRQIDGMPHRLRLSITFAGDANSKIK